MMSIAHRRFACALLVVLGLSFAADASGAGAMVADGGFGGAMVIDEHRVHVVLNHGIAVTTVTQVFRNAEDRIVEGLYTFPVPRGASVAGFSMWINGREMVGEVIEKKHAREIYDSYKRKRQDPGLLEQADYKTFEMRVFPIAARAQQKVEITYYQEIDIDHDQGTYVYPLATTAADAQGRAVSASRAGTFALTMDVRSPIPISAMESPSHAKDFVFAAIDEHTGEASIELKDGDLSRDVVVSYRLARPQTGLDLVASRRADQDGYFYLTLTAGDELAVDEAGQDFVFVLDISGSMADGGKLAMSEGSIREFINVLGANDRCEIMTFNIQPHALFAKLEPVNDQVRAKAAEFLGGQQARGGTVLAPAMHQAYRYADTDRTLNVIILSDGMTDQGERAELLRLIGTRPKSARVFCIGVGNDVNRPLLTQMAEESGGLSAFISRGDDFQRQAKAFRRKLVRPAATDLAIAVNGVEIYDVVPRTLPNLFHGAPVRVYGRYRMKGGGDALAKATVTGAVLGKPLTQVFDLRFPAHDTANGEIERMWASHRIDGLLRDADRTGSREQVIPDIVRLGEGYSIASEYTSFLVLENDAEYQRWSIARRNEQRFGRDRVAQQKLREELDTLRSKGARDIIGPVQEEAAPPMPTAIAVNSPGGQVPDQTVAANPRQPRRDPSFGGGGGGGGAIDPLGAALAFLAALIAVWPAVWQKLRTYLRTRLSSRI